MIRSKPANRKYRDNYDRIFRRSYGDRVALDVSDILEKNLYKAICREHVPLNERK